jgi:hypothetical protein
MRVVAMYRSVAAAKADGGDKPHTQSQACSIDSCKAIREGRMVS